jgi:transposase
MGSSRWGWIVPEGLWEIARPLLPPSRVRPQGGGTHDRPDLRRWWRGKRIATRIARKGVDSSQQLGRHRWVIERTMSWLSGYRRLSPRCERHPRNHLGFLGLAAALT